MKFIKKVIFFIKDLLNKEKAPKMIEAPTYNSKNDDKVKFLNSLKVNLMQNKKRNKVDTLICFGDGLGIQDKISY